MYMCMYMYMYMYICAVLCVSGQGCLSYSHIIYLVVIVVTTLIYKVV